MRKQCKAELALTNNFCRILLDSDFMLTWCPPLLWMQYVDMDFLSVICSNVNYIDGRRLDRTITKYIYRISTIFKNQKFKVADLE